MKANAIVRIIIFSFLILVLSGILIGNICYDKFAVNLKITQGELTVGPIASAEGEQVTLGALSSQAITDLEIQWALGSVTIVPGTETNTIRLWDNYNGKEKYRLYYVTDHSTLKIQYCKDGWEFLGIGTVGDDFVEKNLVVEVPQGWIPEELDIEAGAVKILLQDLTLKDVKIQAGSGAIDFENCHVSTLDIDTASADVIFSGTLDMLECDSASASIVASLQNVPRALDLDSASGNLDITLPESAGFTAELESLSGEFYSEFDCSTQHNRYICGDGKCSIEVSAISGNVNIRKHHTENHHKDKHHN